MVIFLSTAPDQFPQKDSCPKREEKCGGRERNGINLISFTAYFMVQIYVSVFNKISQMIYI